MAEGFEFFPQGGADFFDDIEAWKPAGQMYADTDHNEGRKDLQDKMGITRTEVFHHGLTKGPGDGPGQGIADQAAEVEDGSIAEQPQGLITHGFGQAHGQATDDTTAHPQAMDSAKQADDKGVKDAEAQVGLSENFCPV